MLPTQELFVPGTGGISSRCCRARARPTAAPAGCRGAFEQLRTTLAARLPEDDCQQADTSAPPVKHPSRVRGAHAEWFYGLRLAVKTDLGTRIVRARSIVPAAVRERDVAGDLLD